jgi:hypothetical protein
MPRPLTAYFAEFFSKKPGSAAVLSAKIGKSGTKGEEGYSGLFD